MEPAPSLYKRLTVVDPTGTPQSGRAAIALIVDDFVANLLADPRVSRRFTSLPGPAVTKFKSTLADQICDATGGPCSYLGRDMKAAHAGMGITDAEWSATVEDLVKSLNKFKVGAKEQQELLAILGPMKKEIVGQ
jgi:hemoglobin